MGKARPTFLTVVHTHTKILKAYVARLGKTKRKCSVCNKFVQESKLCFPQNSQDLSTRNLHPKICAFV